MGCGDNEVPEISILPLRTPLPVFPLVVIHRIFAGARGLPYTIWFSATTSDAIVAIRGPVLHNAVPNGKCDFALQVHGA